MPTLLQNAATWHAGKMKQAAGREVSILQGANIYEEIDGWFDSHNYEVEDNEGFRTSLRVYDWRFLATDLPSGFKFRAGDQIQEAVSTEIHIYEVLPMPGLPASESADSHDVIVIAHCKKVM